MATWATRRKLSYTTAIVLVLVVAVAVPAFFTFYKAPTCFDGIQNNGEQGIDCGGGCKKLCQSAFLPAKVVWADAQRVTAGIYNFAAYIENPNINGAASNVPFTFSAYDSEGVLIATANGVVTIPVGRNVLAFVSGVNFGTRVPKSGGVIFEFTQAPQWQKAHDTLQELSPTQQKYTEDANTSSELVTLSNSSLVPYTNIDVFTVLSDKDGNVVDFSKTHVDSVPPKSTQVAPFTWPYSHNGAVVSEEALYVVPPAFDSQ